METLIKKGYPVGGKKRFNPGHYYSCPRLYGDPGQEVEDWSTIIASAASGGELATTPGLLGAQIRFGWAQLEPTEGDYATGIALIQAKLDDLKFSSADGGWKKLSLVIDTKTFGAFHVVPAYMRDSITDGVYGGGEHNFASTNGGSASGYIVRFNNANVCARFGLLVQALGAAFAFEDQIELISLPELNIPGMPSGSTYTMAEAMSGHFAGGLTCLDHIIAAFPYTIVRQISNYTRPELSAMIPSYTSRGVCIGGPDTLMNEVGLEVITNAVTNQGIYPWLREKRGNLPIAMEIQPVDYRFTTSSGGFRIEPANGWAASVTVSDGGGGTILLSSATIDHGLSATDMMGILNIYGTTDAVLNILTTAGGWTAGTNFTIVSVPTTKNIVISGTYSGQTAPTGMKQAPVGGYPITNQTYDPDTSKTYTGFIPTIQQLNDFLITEFNCNYIIWTREATTVNTLEGETNHLRVRKWINTVASKYGRSGGCGTARPSAIA